MDTITPLIIHFHIDHLQKHVYATPAARSGQVREMGRTWTGDGSISLPCRVRGSANRLGDYSLTHSSLSVWSVGDCLMIGVVIVIRIFTIGSALVMIDREGNDRRNRATY